MYTYEEVISKIEHSRRFGNLPGVEVTGQALEVLGHPQEGMRYVHVAGTNGKGSVCAFMSSILKVAGKKVGVFTSPHLVDFEERIVVDGRMIAKEDVTRLGNLLLETDFGVTPTMFDYCLLMAILFFKEQDCDVVVIETGLGGRLDSTNALGTPEVSVITAIGYDHVDILGHTLVDIAREKAGILKKGTILVLETQEAEAEQVILEQAKKAGVRGVHKVNENLRSKVRQMNLKIPGIHQWENASAAMLAAAQILLPEMLPMEELRGVLDGERENLENAKQNKIIISAFDKMDELCRQGLESATWRGRMEILSEEPFLMVDGAHNGHGVKMLGESLRMLYPDERFHFIMGVMADKDYEQMIETILPLALDVTTVTPESERALQAKELAEKLQKKGIRSSCADSVEQAVTDLSKEGKTIAFGSLYFIGELEALRGKNA